MRTQIVSLLFGLLTIPAISSADSVQIGVFITDPTTEGGGTFAFEFDTADGSAVTDQIVLQNAKLLLRFENGSTTSYTQPLLGNVDAYEDIGPLDIPSGSNGIVEAKLSGMLTNTHLHLADYPNTAVDVIPDISVTISGNYPFADGFVSLQYSNIYAEEVTPVPEPTAAGLLGTGVFVLLTLLFWRLLA